MTKPTMQPDIELDLVLDAPPQVEAATADPGSQRRKRGKRAQSQPPLPQGAAAPHSLDGDFSSTRHALVTGGGRGIGAAIAEALLKAGYRVSIAGRSLRALQALAQRHGARCTPIAMDVTDRASVEAGVALARSRQGAIDVLINNAGQAESAPLMKTSELLWRRMLAVNLDGTYRCTQVVLPDMLARGSGRIINIASTAGLRGSPYISAYAAAKHAVVGFTRALALELASQHITVNAICPGYTDTELVRTALSNIKTRTGRDEQAALNDLLRTNPQARLVRPEEVAHTVLWLLDDAAESVSGQAIAVDGGGTA